MFGVDLSVMEYDELNALICSLEEQMTKTTGTWWWTCIDTPSTLSLSQFVDHVDDVLAKRREECHRKGKY